MSDSVTISLSDLPTAGKLAVTLKNDILFHSTMSHSKIALEGLITSLLGISGSDIRSVDVTNPMDYPDYSSKEVILDVRVEFNSNHIISLELQTYIDPNWIDRSVLYLCRTYDHLSSGEQYQNTKYTYLIAIMDYDLFPEYPEFYAQFSLSNVRYHYEYTSKMHLNMLNLRQISLATDDDIHNGLVMWAKLFSAKTWEELLAVANEHPVAKEVAITMYTLTAEEKDRYLMEAHERFLAVKRGQEQHIFNTGYQAGYDKAAEERDLRIAELEDLLATYQNDPRNN